MPDGGSLVSKIDEYLVLAHPMAAGYLYVFQVDTAGKVSWLFPRNEAYPLSCGQNPVPASAWIQIPSQEADQVLYLDERGGVEHVYGVFSATPWTALETALAKASRESAIAA